MWIKALSRLVAYSSSNDLSNIIFIFKYLSPVYISPFVFQSLLVDLKKSIILEQISTNIISFNFKSVQAKGGFLQFFSASEFFERVVIKVHTSVICSVSSSHAVNPILCLIMLFSVVLLVHFIHHQFFHQMLVIMDND